MSQAPAVPATAGRQCLRLPCVDWQTYTRFLRLFAERPGYRLTYDRGELEIMSPSLQHDKGSRFLGRLVVALTEELGLPLQSGGSVTMRRRRRRQGVEADECFWIANAHCMAGRDRFDPRRDPPPDLAIEVDVSRSSLNRLGIYAALGVPEVWRLDGDILIFHLLDAGGTYTSGAPSRAFPLVAPAELVPFVQQARTATDSNDIIRQFRAWVRQRAGLANPGSP